MGWIPDRYRELRMLLGARIDEDVDEELASHLALRAADLEAEGLSEAQARDEALRRFGDVGRYRYETVQIDESVRKEQRRMEILDAVRRETRHAARSLWRAPAFALVAILTLGLGIGGTTSIYTLVDSIVLRPLPYPAANRLVWMRHDVPGVQDGQYWGNSVASFFYYLDNNRTFELLGAHTGTTVNLSGDGEAERVQGTLVMASVLPAVGARAVRGRLFTEADGGEERDAVAVLSHELWLSRYGGDPSIVGRTVTMNASPVMVIGIMAPGVRLPMHQPAVWQPLVLDRSAPPVNSHWVSTIGVLRPGVTAEAARADLQRLTNELPARFPNAYSAAFMQESGFQPNVIPLREQVLGGVDDVLWLLLGAVALVLLIACANVANLLLVRAEMRRRELTVRSALGAERAHLAVHYLTESILLALLAGALGVLLAYGGIRLLLSIAPASLPRLDEIALSSRSVAFALVVAVLTGLLFGLVPLLRSRIDFNELREGGRGLTPSRRRQLIRGTLVVAQVAMALVLLAAGGLMLQSFLNLRNVKTGFVADNVLTFHATPPFARYPDLQSVHTFQRELLSRISALPGVLVASGTTFLPLDGNRGCAYTTWEGKVFDRATENPPCLPVTPVLPGYFEALGIPVRGEPFDWAEVERRRGVVVVSRAVAERLWPGEDPIGKGILSYRDGPPWYRVIGVADDVLGNSLDEPPVEAIYYPTLPMQAAGVMGSGPWRGMTYVVKTATEEPEQLAAAIRRIVAELDPAVPVASVRTMEEMVKTSPAIARRSFTMVLLAVAAALALFLSAVGLYGVIAYLVGRRRSEIGVRMALGARVSQVGALVVLQSVRLAALGVAIGIVGAIVLTRMLESLLFGIEPADARTIAAVSALLLAVAALASLLPARRAARTDPVEALRAE